MKDREQCQPCEDAAERRRQQTAYRKARLARACGGLRALRLYTPEAFEIIEGNREAYSAATSFLPARDNLYLWGPCGVGKSHLAALIGRRLAEANTESDREIIWMEPPELLRSLRGLDAYEEQRKLAEYFNIPVLIIDDLGVEKDTEFAISILTEIVSRRLRDDRNGLVVTSNLSLDALAEKLQDDRLTSRLAGMCQAFGIVDRDRRLS